MPEATLNDLLGNFSDPKYQYMNSMVQDEAQKQGLDPNVLKALIDVESKFNPLAKSKKGAVGLTQLMPKTAQSVGVSDRTNPQQSIAGGASYLKGLLNRFGSLDKALAAYNYGPTNVAKGGRQPASVNNYVSRVKNRAEGLNRSGPLTGYLNMPIESRAAGGFVEADNPYLVGELGGEKVVPQQNAASINTPVSINTPAPVSSNPVLNTLQQLSTAPQQSNAQMPSTYVPNTYSGAGFRPTIPYTTEEQTAYNNYLTSPGYLNALSPATTPVTTPATTAPANTSTQSQLLSQFLQGQTPQVQQILQQLFPQLFNTQPAQTGTTVPQQSNAQMPSTYVPNTYSGAGFRPTIPYTTEEQTAYNNYAATVPQLQSRQEGGDVDEDKPYVVGEKGPEVIVPKKDGYVIPNQQNLFQRILQAVMSALDNSGKHAPPYMQPGISPELKQQMIDREGFSGYDSPWPYCQDLNKVQMKAIEHLEDGGYMETGQPYIVGEAGEETVVPNYGTRLDGTPKGPGFLGSLKRPDGKISTELSIGVNIDGKETLIPSLVPTLTKQEIDYLLKMKKGDKIPKEIVDKAVKHAEEQMKQGKSPFKDEPVIPDWAKGRVGYGIGQFSPGQFVPQTGGIKLNTPESDAKNPKLDDSVRGRLNQMLGPDAWQKACEWNNRYEQL